MAGLIFEQVNSPCGEVLGLVECPGPPVCVVSIVRSGDILQVKTFALGSFDVSWWLSVD